MKLSINYILLTVIAFLLCSCQVGDKAGIPEYLSTKKIPNWNEIYPLLLVNAQEWDPDAGLKLMVMEVNSQDRPEKRVVGAFFETHNKEFEFLYLKYLEDGSIEPKIDTYGVSISNYDLIDNTMWTINSTDAWAIFLQNPDVTSFSNKDFDCATLILINKKIGLEKKKVVWQLALDDCEQDKLTLFLIDANTGEFLRKETH